MPQAFTAVTLAVETGVVVIVVAGAVLAVVLIAALSMRGARSAVVRLAEPSETATLHNGRPNATSFASRF
jgi:hypothetical protein